MLQASVHAWNEEEFKCEDNIRFFENIEKFASASFYKGKKKNGKYIFTADSKSLLDQVITNYC